MSRINPLDDNPIIDYYTNYDTDTEPRHYIEPMIQRTYYPQALQNQDQGFNTLYQHIIMTNYSHIPQALQNQHQNIISTIQPLYSMRHIDRPIEQIEQIINAGERLVSNPEPVFPTSRLPRRLTAREQRQERLNRNRQNHK
jgi:hypothetical protein